MGVVVGLFLAASSPLPQPPATLEIQIAVKESEHDTQKILPTQAMSPKERVTKRYNVEYRQGLGSGELACLEVLDYSSYPLPPREVAKRAKINPNSARVYLKRLRNKGFAVCPFPRHYQSVRNIVTKEGVGLERVVLRCHKLMFVVRGVSDVVLGKRVLVDNDLFKVVAVGYRNGTVNVFVDCKGSYSFDYGAFLCLVELTKRELRVEDEEAIEIKSFELNVDHKGLQLEGVQCVTLKGFKGAFERLYNKDKQTLRNEVNLQRSLPVESAYALLKGGVTPYNVFQANFMLVQEVRLLFEAVKFGNRTQAEFLLLLKELSKGLLKEVSSQ